MFLSSSVDSKLTAIHTSTSSLNSFTSSQNSKNTALFTATASLNSYTASNITNINAIHTFTASVNLNNDALNIATASLNSYTSSLKTAIELTGSAVTIKGDLLVKGTTSTINSTTIQLDDNIISLNAACLS